MGKLPGRSTYIAVDATRKADFVRRFIEEERPQVVWDLGCNTGEFSEVALNAGADYVVGFDVDHGALDKAFARSRDRKLALQTIYQDAANPTPGQGWLLTERGTIEQRGTPDGILALAFEHHLAIARNIPLDELVQWLTGLAKCGVIEFVQKSDTTIRRMLATREDVSRITLRRIFGSHCQGTLKSRVKKKSQARIAVLFSFRR